MKSITLGASLVFAMFALVMARTVGAQWGTDTTIAGCSKIWFVSGAGIRMRSDPKVDSKVLAILTYDTPICVYTEKMEWAEVSLDGSKEKGWIQKQFISAERADRSSVYGAMLTAQGAGDFASAISFAERLLELEENKSLERQIELLEKLGQFYRRTNDSKKLKEIEARVTKLEQAELASPEGSSLPPSLFDNWFALTFENSSRSESGFYNSPMKVEQVLAVLGEIQSRVDTGEEALVAHDKVVGKMPGFLSKVYADTFGPKSVPSYGVLKRVLLKEPILKAALLRAKTSDGIGVDPSILSIIPANVLNEDSVFALIMSHCDVGNLGPAWQLIEERNVKKRTKEFLICIQRSDLEKAIQRFRFLASLEVLRVALSQGSRLSDKLSIIYGQLTEADRGNKDLLNELMTAKVDIYRYLPKRLQKKKEMRDYAAKWSSCENIVAVDPGDRELLLGVQHGLTLACAQKISPRLKKDKKFASEFLAKAPSLVAEFGEEIQLDPNILEILIKGPYPGRCIFTTLPKQFPLRSKRKLVRANRQCLELLDARDFTDPEIYRLVISNLIEFPVLQKLPSAYKNDPNVTLMLPRFLSGADDDNLMVEYTKDSVLLDVAKKSGVAKLAEVVSRRYDDHPHFEYYRTWSPAEHLEPAFWHRLLDISKKRGDSCSDWQKLIDAWALNVLSSSSNREGLRLNPYGFPLEALNASFGCEFETADSPKYEGF